MDPNIIEESFDMMELSDNAISCDYESRDISDFEEIYFSSEDEGGVLNEDEAVFRGLAACEFQDTYRGLSELDNPMGHFEGLQHLAPKPNFQEKTSHFAVLPQPSLSSVPSLTDQLGFVSKDRLHCSGNVDSILEVLRSALALNSCAVESHECSQFEFSVMHFSREFLSIEFEVHIWDIKDQSLCQSILPSCPSDTQYLIEFNKLSGCAFRWKDLFAVISKHVFDTMPNSFPTPAPKRMQKLDDQMLFEDDDIFIIEEQNSCFNDMIKMLDGSFESQKAAATAIAQSCVTKQACSQLISSGFLEAAQKILRQYSLHKDKVSNAQLPLLRCILLAISTVIFCADEMKMMDRNMRTCLSNLQATNPNIFTQELAPLTRALGVH